MFNRQRYYPTLYLVVLTQPSTLNEWHRPLRELPHAPAVIRSGISRPESLIHLVRDAVLRPDKVHTGVGENPAWCKTKVDEGADDKRHVIMQRLGPQLESSRRLGARNLLDTLNAAYEDGSASAYVSYRDGGFHGTKTAHFVLLLPETDPKVAVALWDQLPILLAKADGPVICPDISKLDEVLFAAFDAIENAPPEVTVAPQAREILESGLTSERPYALVTLLRLAHILAVLEYSSVVTITLLLQAVELMQSSESTYQEACKIKFKSLNQEIVEFVRTVPHRISGSQIARHFRKYRREEIRFALSDLRENGQLACDLVKTTGRPREEWSIRKAS